VWRPLSEDPLILHSFWFNSMTSVMTGGASQCWLAVTTQPHTLFWSEFKNSACVNEPRTTSCVALGVFWHQQFSLHFNNAKDQHKRSVLERYSTSISNICTISTQNNVMGCRNVGHSTLKFVDIFLQPLKASFHIWNAEECIRDGSGSNLSITESPPLRLPCFMVYFTLNGP